jgi:hypothetical protein
MSLSICPEAAPAILEGEKPSFFESFAKISTTFENEVYKDYQVFIFTNEEGENKTIAKLKTIARLGNAFIGTSGFCSLNLASVREISYIVMIDPSSRTKLFWERIGSLIITFSKREESLEKIQEHIRENLLDYQDTIRDIEFLCEELEQETSWLSDDVRFERIYKIFKNKQFVFLQADITDFAVCKQVKKIFKEFRIQVDTAYLSNIHDCLFPQRYESYGKSLKYLLSDHSIIVDTNPREFKFSKYFEFLFKEYFLENLIVFERTSRHGKFKVPLLTQRVRERKNMPIETLYPMIGLVKEGSEELFFRYALMMGYSKEEEVEQIDRELEEIERKIPFNENIPLDEKYWRSLKKAMLRKIYGEDQVFRGKKSMQ